MIKLPPIALWSRMHVMLVNREFFCIPEVIFRNSLLAKIMWKIHGSLMTWRVLAFFFACYSQDKSYSVSYVFLHCKASRRLLPICSHLLFVAGYRFLSILPLKLVTGIWAKCSLEKYQGMEKSVTYFITLFESSLTFPSVCAKIVIWLCLHVCLAVPWCLNLYSLKLKRRFG